MKKTVFLWEFYTGIESGGGENCVIGRGCVCIQSIADDINKHYRSVNTQKQQKVNSYL